MQSPIQRALTLLTSACPETPPQQLAELSIGQRDALLLTLREWTFGTQIQSLATCPECGENLELTFSVADIRVATPTQLTEKLIVNFADYEIELRLPNSLDLMTVSDSITLLERCLLGVYHQGKVQSTQQLPTDVVNAVVAKMAQADPQADLQLNLVCPACSHQWLSTFDIVAFFWSEIQAWAVRTIRSVHILATAYGWREADILAMSPYRRQLYLEMVGK